jgi:hypothetical protein
MMDDPNDVLSPTLVEARRILQEMSETKDLETRKAQSEVLLNLCRSAGVFFDLMTNTMLADLDDEFMDEFVDDEDDDDGKSPF